MATFQKRGDTWRAIIRMKGVTDSATFPRKGEASAWATRREAEINAGLTGRVPDKTFGELCTRYRDEISVKKRGARWESVRLTKLIEGRPDTGIPPDPLCDVRLVVLRQQHMAAWRDRRLLQVSDATVLRELKLLSSVCTKAIEEWGWLLAHPMKGIKRPDKPDGRDRRISPTEIDSILHCSGYSPTVPPCTMTARVGLVFLFAIETGMRAGEICALNWADVKIEEKYCTVTGIEIGGGKTPSARRDVALSREAVRLIQQIPLEGGNERVFRISSTQSLDALFRKIKARAGIEDLHFHDTRHEAITRLSKKMDVLALARMVGHKNINELRTYYNESASDIAELLD